MRSSVLADTRNPLSMLGAVLVAVSAALILLFFGLDLVGYEGSPYSGILAFVILPTALAMGLVLFNVGAWRERRRRARAPEQPVPPMPIMDLNQPRTRQLVLAGSVVATFLLVVLSLATYKGVEVMDSTRFCGTTCHNVMKPEFTAYQRSPHARVRCTECHIGSGASWFVKSKLSGTRQLFAVAFNTYPTPIPTPVHNLRPARETCEQCHWPQKFVGQRLKVIPHYTDDEEAKQLKTVLLLNVGGVEKGQGKGIHWHVDPSFRIRYTSDSKREQIQTVELTGPDGKVKVFKRQPGASDENEAEGEAKKPAQPVVAEAGWRTMDCVDCHNRPTHVLRMPEAEVDDALAQGTLDAKLPFIRREGVRLLNEKWTSADAARDGIAKGLAAFYAKENPDVATARAADIQKAGEALAKIWSLNVFPEMKVTWGTYPNFLGHKTNAGCMRCHGGALRTDAGEKISGSCNLCHRVLAEDEENPEVLSQLAQ